MGFFIGKVLIALGLVSAIYFTLTSLLCGGKEEDKEDVIDEWGQF